MLWLHIWSWAYSRFARFHAARMAASVEGSEEVGGDGTVEGGPEIIGGNAPVVGVASCKVTVEEDICHVNWVTPCEVELEPIIRLQLFRAYGMARGRGDRHHKGWGSRLGEVEAGGQEDCFNGHIGNIIRVCYMSSSSGCLGVVLVERLRKNDIPEYIPMIGMGGQGFGVFIFPMVL
jgi:hypothetical protein